jgi:hypothetical protein
MNKQTSILKLTLLAVFAGLFPYAALQTVSFVLCASASLALPRAVPPAPDREHPPDPHMAPRSDRVDRTEFAVAPDGVLDWWRERVPRADSIAIVLAIQINL